MSLQTLAQSAIAKQSGHRVKSTKSARLLWAASRQKKSIDILRDLTTFVNTLESLVPIVCSFAYMPAASHFTGVSGDSQQSFKRQDLHGAGLLPTQPEGSVETRVLQTEPAAITAYPISDHHEGGAGLVRRHSKNVKLQRARKRRTQSRTSAQHVSVAHVCALERYASAF